LSDAPFIKIDGTQLDDNLIADLTVTQELNSHWWCHINLRQTQDRRFPAEDMLGKTVQISTFDDQGAENKIFAGMVIESELEYEIHGSYTARLAAVTRSYLLDLCPRRQYFPSLTARSVAEKLVTDAGLAIAGDMPAGETEKYHQLEESDWSFVLRLVDDVESWIRPAESGVEAWSSFQRGIELSWREECGLLSFRTRGRLSQPSTNGAHYDPATMESRVYQQVSDPPAFYGSVSALVDAVRTQSKDLFPPDYIYQRARAGTLDAFHDRLKRESRRSIGSSITCHGESRNPELMAGNEVKITGPLDAAGTYGLIKVVHTWTAAGYLNYFDCTPWRKFTNPVAPRVRAYPGLIPARVVDNNDPDNSGRVRVQFYWQEENSTKWIAMMAPHAGADRGFMFLPEIGDEVWVAFEQGDPERPRVLGCSWNGVQKPPRDEFWGDDVAPNDVKRIVTKSGHRISMVDKNGKSSIVVATPQHVRLSLIENSNETGDSMLALHSDGDIFVSAPNGRIHLRSAKFSREVGAGQGSTELPLTALPSAIETAALATPGDVTAWGAKRSTPPKTTPKKKVTVAISLSLPVACPGHPLSVTAVGSPGGGTYSWSVSGGDAQLVDSSGNAAATDATVYLRSFKPDDAKANIPPGMATVKVTYTHPDGTANDTKKVPIHGIEFDVTDMTVTGGVTQANEFAGGVRLGNAPGVPTMSTNPKVKIKLGAACPRKAACASNHQVGFLQTVLTNDRRVRYTHTLIAVTVSLPIRDQISGPKPFYDGVVPFSGDGDQRTVHHEDSPAQGAGWTDPRPAAPVPPPPQNRQLRQMFFSNAFRVWLVVQNIEWAAHDKDGSFIFLRNFDWSMSLNTTVDTAQAVGSRCTPSSKAATIGAVGTGKGSGNPNLADPYPNVNHTVTTTSAPGI